jgi:hypothetical protein
MRYLDFAQAMTDPLHQEHRARWLCDAYLQLAKRCDAAESLLWPGDARR